MITQGLTSQAKDLGFFPKRIKDSKQGSDMIRFASFKALCRKGKHLRQRLEGYSARLVDSLEVDGEREGKVKDESQVLGVKVWVGGMPYTEINTGEDQLGKLEVDRKSVV